MIYVGLNDSITRKQKYDTDTYLHLLKTVCLRYHVAFSLQEIKGGYFHEDGSYVEENSLVLTLIDVEYETVKEIAKDLCAFFHQESVMVTRSSAEVEYISETLF